MPDTNQTREALDIPGEMPTLTIFEKLFAALTPQQRIQVVRELDSLLAARTA